MAGFLSHPKDELMNENGTVLYDEGWGYYGDDDWMYEDRLVRQKERTVYRSEEGNFIKMLSRIE